MRIKKDERQIRTIAWIEELEQYAKAQKLPMRILDELEECKQLASSNRADQDKVNRTIEELMESIEGKLAPAEVQQENVIEEVSVEEVKMQLRKMAQRCNTENFSAVEGMAERKNIVVRKMYGQLSEIGHVRAHLEELKNEDLYLLFFEKCRVSFERDVLEMVGELLQSIRNNYGYMLDHMRSMFQSIGGYKKGIGNEKFYLEYQARRGGIDQRVLGEAQTADMGGDDLISFGQKTKDKVKGIVGKLVWKRKLLAWVPLVVLLCLFTVTSVVRQEQSRQTLESAEQTEEKEDSLIKDIAGDLGKKTVESVSGGALQSMASLLLALLASLGVLFVAVVLVIVVLYRCYLKILKRWCDNKICKRCGEYLQTELSQFQQNNSFFLKLDTVMKNAVEEYERQYMEVLNSLFADTGYADQPAQKEGAARWDTLRQEWEQLKYR